MKQYIHILLPIAIITIFIILFTMAQTNQNKQSSRSQNNQKTVKPLQPEKTTQYNQPPVFSLEEEKDYSAEIQTNKGTIYIDLYEKEAPNTVNNFVFLANEGFYNGVIFHRVIQDFMIQGGDPTGTGRSGPGYTFEDEINDINLVKGSVAMANAGPNTNGSQFFIVTAEETPWLDGHHTNFGMVTKGMEVVEEIESSKTMTQDKPIEDIIIESITIR